MGKKKSLKGLSSEEIDYIEEKLSFDHAYDNKNEHVMNMTNALSYKLNIKCKNERQKEFLNNLKDEEAIINFGVGSAGTGKSYISLSYALSKIKDGSFEKIIVVVPTAQASGKDMGVGFLKGELDDKTKPFKDVDRYTIEKILKTSGNLEYKSIASYLISNGVIQYEFINFMLGKTFDKSLILVNEAEQYTKDDMKLILTRLGEGSKLIISGDVEQVNRQSIVKKQDICGLSYACDKLSKLDNVKITVFKREDIVRNPFITKILDCFDDNN